MLDLGEGDVMEELDQELTREVSLVVGKSFNGDEDGRGGNDEGIQGKDSGCQKKGESDQLSSGQGCVGRFISWSGGEIWHAYGGGLEQR